MYDLGLPHSTTWRPSPPTRTFVLSAERIEANRDKFYAELLRGRLVRRASWRCHPLLPWSLGTTGAGPGLLHALPRSTPAAQIPVAACGGGGMWWWQHEVLPPRLRQSGSFRAAPHPGVRAPRRRRRASSPYRCRAAFRASPCGRASCSTRRRRSWSTREVRWASTASRTGRPCCRCSRRGRSRSRQETPSRSAPRWSWAAAWPSRPGTLLKARCARVEGSVQGLSPAPGSTARARPTESNRPPGDS